MRGVKEIGEWCWGEEKVVRLGRYNKVERMVRETRFVQRREIWAVGLGDKNRRWGVTTCGLRCAWIGPGVWVKPIHLI